MLNIGLAMGGSPIPRKVTNVQVLRFDDPPKGSRKKKSSSKFLLPISLLIAVGLFGSTFAANISINSDQSLEFGQGVLSAAACDSTINITPAATFDNGSSTGVFRFGEVTLSGVEGDCVGKVLTLRAYDNNASNDTPLTLGTTSGGVGYSTIAMTWASSSAPTASLSGAYTITQVSTTSARVTIGTAALTAGGLYKMTIESSGS